MLTDLAAIEGLVDFQPSYFELLTAAAFRWFSDEAVSAAVVEVGLLGRWDATNVVDGIVAVLTNVGHDHTDGLGDWRRRIAEEKAGIVKEGATFVLGETDPALADVFDATPAAEVWRRGVDFACESNELAVGGRLLDLRTPGSRYEEVFLPLHGAHQGENAAVAVAAAEAFFGRPLDPDIVFDALAAVRNPGRFEVVQHDPLLILDGAHNREGAIAAAEALAEGFTVTGLTHLVIGVLDGRDPAELLEILDAEGAETVVCCAPDSPRALPAAELAELVRGAGGRPVVVDDVGEALERALASRHPTTSCWSPARCTRSVPRARPAAPSGCCRAHSARRSPPARHHLAQGGDHRLQVRRLGEHDAAETDPLGSLGRERGDLGWVAAEDIRAVGQGRRRRAGRR